MRVRTPILVLAVASLAAVSCSSSDGPTSESSSQVTPGDSAPIDSGPTAPDATDPDPTDPDATDPDATDPDTTDPDTTDPDTTDPDGGSTLDWAPCDEQPNPASPTECATLMVPLDHGSPDGETIEIAVARVDSAGGDDQIGSLVFNPGGPGGSGIEFLAQAAAIVPGDVSSRFDLVSFDPRGVGASTAVDCDIEFDDEITLLPADDDAAWEAQLADAAESLEKCSDSTFDIAPYLGTDNAARDLDLLRAALGDEGLSYVGYSYGTRLGASYAELFPDNVRALVLDGAVKPSTDSAELGPAQAAGFDRALENFAEACDADADCLLTELGPTLDIVSGLQDEIAEEGTFPTDDPDRVLTPGELDLGIISSLYSKDSWPFLAQALYLADTEQDGTLLQVLTDSYLGRRPDGTYTNSQVANSFINCADEAARDDADTIRADGEEAAAATTYFAGFFRASTGCIGIPDSADPLTIGPASGAAPILVIGSTGDPATPYEWAVELTDVLESAVLYTVEAEGHTAYGTIECVSDVVGAYLVDLDVPDEGASCSDNEDADFFVPAGEGQIDQLLTFLDCLRDEGADIPDVSLADVLADPTLETVLGEFDPNDPDSAAAVLACQELIPDL